MTERLDTLASTIRCRSLIGRDRELSFVRQAIASAESGAGPGIGQVGDPSGTEQNVAWVREMWEELQPHARGTYLNFLGDSDDQALVRAAYGENYERLTRLKAEYDPENLFRLNGNIQPAT